jgi:predicted kinase
LHRLIYNKDSAVWLNLQQPECRQKKTGLHPCTPEKVIKKYLRKKQQKQLVGKESFNLVWYYQVLTCNSV